MNRNQPLKQGRKRTEVAASRLEGETAVGWREIGNGGGLDLGCKEGGSRLWRVLPGGLIQFLNLSTTNILDQIILCHGARGGWGRKKLSWIL